ncbi:hypothetical protein [Aeoliella sp.]|uniref:hypothetical protein n=1 Tax=Aeoliella sp. TaxID=2795800 RepID=UPI003CCB92D0
MTGKVRTLEGRPHYVFPATLLVVGEHEGNNGLIEYSYNELAATASLWNGVPILLEHPPMGPAGTPQVHDSQRVGTVFNAAMNGHALNAEAWLDIQRLEAIAPNVLQAIGSSQTVEVSTGLYISDSSTRNSTGAIVGRGLLPNHLALLPHTEGACSIRAGCGMRTV